MIPGPPVRRPRIARSVARRIDRLARRAHAFHRFAHHPLCTHYAGEMIRIGKTRLCRGCSYAFAGGLAGGAAGLVLGGSTPIAAAALAAGTSLLALSLRVRPPKTITRFVPAALAALAITCGVLTFHLPGYAVAAATIAIVGLLRVLYSRRGPDRTPCIACPERDRGPFAAVPDPTLPPCSGLVRIVSRERAFQRIAGRWMDEARDQAIRRSAISSGDGPRIEA